MCGILGIYNKELFESEDKDLLEKMSDTLHHRGPDDSQYFMDDTIGMAFRRLSIIDIKGGGQPMSNEDDSIVLICNGEIYNYKELRQGLINKGHHFKTACDVEVLLHLYEEYGTEFLNKLNGQFAFALYDKKKKTLFLARDHVGIAPLFYATTGSKFIFASEIKAILPHPSIPKAVNLRGLDQLFCFPGVVSPTTLFEDIYSLPPGHYILYSPEGFELREYWDLVYPMEGGLPTYSEDHYREGLESLLRKSIDYRLNADVPVGLYLSGGLDSSLISAISQQLRPSTRKHTFSVIFDQKEISEKAYQRMVASSIGSTHHELLFDVSEIPKRLEKAVFHAEAPLKETYNTCNLALSEMVRSKDMKVVLSGEGADELFAGYVGYQLDETRSAQWTGLSALEEEIEKEIRESLWGDPEIFYDRNYSVFGETRTALYSNRLKQQLKSFDSTTGDLVDKRKLVGRHILHKRSYLDFKLRISDHLIADHGDRVAYANSVETRYPFLDIDLIEFVRNIPPRYKLNGSKNKYLLKKCSESFLPKEIIGRNKFSFVAPGSHYLLQLNLDWVNDLLSYETIKRQGYFDPEVVEKLKSVYSRKDFNLNQTFETDFLLLVLTFGIFLNLFEMPSA
ncbi:MAG TPA: asparagine synthase (glutamine-hydrolyzing) [Puia sp.]|nr:asparagine synthase (glutamine-hydrolyzing) [Puia sp.]